MKIYIITARMEGCNECGDYYSVEGAFTSKDKAEAFAKELSDKIETGHEPRNQPYKGFFHWTYVDVDEIELDEVKP